MHGKTTVISIIAITWVDESCNVPDVKLCMCSVFNNTAKLCGLYSRQDLWQASVKFARNYLDWHWTRTVHPPFWVGFSEGLIDNVPSFNLSSVCST